MIATIHADHMAIRPASVDTYSDNPMPRRRAGARPPGLGLEVFGSDYEVERPYRRTSSKP
jgi:hypothetical protein